MGGGAPQSPARSYRHKEGGKLAERHRYDQVWLSAAPGPPLQGTFIDRWTRRGGDGSDHDPAWVNLDLERREEDMTVSYVRDRLREDLPGHWRRQGPFEDRQSAEDFAQLLEREMPDLDEVKVVAEDAGPACT